MSSEHSTSQGAHDSHGSGEHHSHALPIPLLVGVWLALMALTGLTVLTGTMKLGQFDFVVAMLIATVKATLVAAVFMHLLWDKGMHTILVVSGMLFLALFIGATLFDRAHYQDSIEEHERDHPFPRRFELQTQEPGTGHGEAPTGESGGH